MSWTHPTFEAIARAVCDRTGLSFLLKRQESAELGMRRAMTLANIADPDAYFARIQSDIAALDDLVSELTVGETYFFREPAQFDFIRREVLPEIRRRRGPAHIVRGWSAACASGEEVYSLAILCEQEGLGEQTCLLGTDISRAGLARAIRATYGGWSLRGDGAALVRPYLEPCGERFQLREQIRRRVAFEYLNLSLDAYPSYATNTWGMDLILCRNVLIYFDEATSHAVARRLFDSLAPGGWLVTASTDPPLRNPALPFETVASQTGIFYRRPVRAQALDPKARVVPRPEPDPPRPLASHSAMAPASAAVALPSRSATPLSGKSLLAEARRALARGDNAAAAELTADLLNDVESAVVHVRALANLEPARAESVCRRAVELHPLSEELHYLSAVLLIDLHRIEEATRALRRVIYLDRSLAIAHFTLGSLLLQRRDAAGARRAYRNARDLCVARPADEIVPLSEGEHAERLANAATVQIAILESLDEVIP